MNRIAAVACVLLVAACQTEMTYDPVPESFPSSVTRLPSGSIKGHVVDAKTGRALSEVHLLVNASPPIGVLTDSTGTFALHQVPSGKHILVVTKPGYFYEGEESGPVADVVPHAAIQLPVIRLTPASPSPSHSAL